MLVHRQRAAVALGREGRERESDNARERRDKSLLTISFLILIVTYLFVFIVLGDLAPKKSHT